MDDLFFFKPFQDAKAVIFYYLIELNGQDSATRLFVSKSMKHKERNVVSYLIDQSLQGRLLGLS